MLNNLIFLIKSYQILKMILLLKASAIEMFSGTSHINIKLDFLWLQYKKRYKCKNCQLMK
jgi:hypothetical protein